MTKPRDFQSHPSPSLPFKEGVGVGLLSAIFWLLAIAVCVIPFFFHPSPVTNYLAYFLPSLFVLVSIWLLTRIKRHASAVEPAFQVAVLLGIASFWMPTVVFLIFPAWIYLAYRRLMEMRVFVASLLGFAFVAIWAVVLYYFFPLREWVGVGYYWGWIPVSAVLLAWTASAIAKHLLRVH